MTNAGVQTEVTSAYLTSRGAARALMATAALAVTLFLTMGSSVTVTGGLVAEDAGATPKAYHALLVLAGLGVLARGKIARPRAEVLVYFGVTIASTLLAYLIYEPRVAGIKLLIALYAALVATSLGYVANRDIVLRAWRAAGVAFAIVVTLKNLTPVSAALVVSVFCIIATVFFVPVTLLAAATSALYASRVGVVIAVMALCGAVAPAW